MGAPMARNLLKGGHTVTVFAQARGGDGAAHRPGRARRRLSRRGRVAAATSRSRWSSTRSAVEEVALGPRGVIEGAKPGSVVDRSQHDRSRRRAQNRRRAAKRAASRCSTRRCQGAPPWPKPARCRSWPAATKLCSIASVRFSSATEQTIVHIGPSGAGQVAKACNQICTIVNTLGAAEAMLMAERAGIDPTKVKDVLMTGFGASRMLDMQAPKMIARDFEGKVESRLHYKDIHIVLAMARALGIELPASAAAAQVLTELQKRGGAKRDTAAVFTFWLIPTIPNP